MSRDLGRDVPDLEKLYARKLWADFSYPKSGVATVRFADANGPKWTSSGQNGPANAEIQFGTRSFDQSPANPNLAN